MKIPSVSVLMAATFLFSLGSQGQTDTRSIPAQITTSDGQIYHNVSLIRSEPDGLIVSYQPEGGGVGLAKLKFRNLPDSLRNQYGYDADKAAGFEAQQAQMTAQWRAQATTDNWFQQYRALAELHRSLAGDTFSS